MFCLVKTIHSQPSATALTCPECERTRVQLTLRTHFCFDAHSVVRRGGGGSSAIALHQEGHGFDFDSVYTLHVLPCISVGFIELLWPPSAVQRHAREWAASS